MITINLNNDSFFINQQELKFPISTDNFLLILNSSPRVLQFEVNAVYVWDDLGITAYAKQNDLIDTIEISFKPQGYEQSPRSPFKGQFNFKDQDAISYFFEHPELRIPIYEGDTHKALVAHQTSAWFHGDLKQHELDGISFSSYEAPKTPETLTLDSQFTYLETLWNEWINAIEKVIPKYNRYFNLKHGIQTEDIENLKNYTKIEIPEILINFYKVHNVYWDAVSSAFQFNINDWGYDLLPFEKIYDEWEGITQFNTEENLPKTTYPNYNEQIKINDYTNPKWIPFAEGRNGDYLLIDLDPSPTGKLGQIIELQNESWKRNVIANSLEDLIQITIKQLQEPLSDHLKFLLENG